MAIMHNLLNPAVEAFFLLELMNTDSIILELINWTIGFFAFSV